MCEYCEGNDESYDGRSWMHEYDVTRLFRQSGKCESCEGVVVGNALRVYVSGYGSGIGDHPINYCPMCGRKLGGDAR